MVEAEERLSLRNNASHTYRRKLCICLARNQVYEGPVIEKEQRVPRTTSIFLTLITQTGELPCMLHTGLQPKSNRSCFTAGPSTAAAD